MIADLLSQIILKMIPDDAISKIVNGVKMTKSTLIGADLFQFYHLLTKVVDDAESIFVEINNLHQLCKNNPAYDYSRCRAAGSLREKIDRQLDNVDDCCNLFLKLELALDLVNTSSYKYIRNFLGPKKSYLYALRRAIGPQFGQSETVAIFLQEDDIAYLLREIGLDVEIENKSGENDLEIRRNYRLDYMSDLFERHRDEIIASISNIGDNLFSFSLSRYLEKRQPEKQIEDLRIALAAFYEAIIANFDIKDLLPLVEGRKDKKKLGV